MVGNRRNQLLCIHSAAAFIALVGGAFVVTGWLPPPSPHASRSEVLETFRHMFRVRAGAAMFFFGAALFVAPCVAITAQMRRIEGTNHVLADVQMLSAAIGVLAIQIPGALWLAISYRHDVSASVVVTLNDVSWFLLLGAVGTAVVQNLSIAVCILGSDGQIYPRWVGYTNLWLAVGLMPGVLIPFFKHGPFAWNGLLGFWVVAVAFFVWVFLMWIFTAKAINADVGEPDLA